MRLGGGWIAAGVVYGGVAGGLAAVAALTQDGRFYLAAVLLTVPAGVAALIGVYISYALLEGIGGLVVSVTTTNGDDARWLTVASGIVNVALFVAAAIANLLMLRAVRQSRRSRTGHPPMATDLGC